MYFKEELQQVLEKASLTNCSKAFVLSAITIFLGAALAFAPLLPSGFGYALLVFFPAIWMTLPKRAYSSLFVLSFYLCFSWEIIPAYHNYFPYDNATYLSIITLFISLIGQSLLWIILYPKKTWRLRTKICLLTAAIILTGIPPISTIYWVHILISAGFLFPNLGWLGLALTLALIYLLAFHRNKFNLSCIILLAILSLAANCFYIQPQTPKTITAIDTRSSQFIVPKGETFSSSYRKHTKNIIQKQLDKQPQLIILPENIIEAQTKSFPKNDWKDIIDKSKKSNTTIIAGTMLTDKENNRYEGFTVISSGKAEFENSRQPIPGIGWVPFDEKSVQAYWLQSNVIEAKGERIHLSICFEDGQLWANISALARNPTVIVSIINHWWNPPSAKKKQYYAMDAWGRLFGLPVIRAVNH